MLTIASTIAKRARTARRFEPLNPNRTGRLRLRRRLRQTIAAFLTAQAPKITGQIIVLRGRLGKAAITQDELDALDRVVAAIDFSGWATLVGDVEPLISEIVADESIAAFAQIHFDTEARSEVLNVVNTDAVEYAQERAAAMVGMRRDELGRLVPNPNAEWRIDEGTRDYLRAIVRDAIATGQSNEDLAQTIEGAYAFSGERALMIARTETNRASNEGALNAYKASGVVDGKQWITADDDLVSEECQENGVAGPEGDGVLLDLDADYPSGDAAPPVHPNCRCALVPFIEFNKE